MSPRVAAAGGADRRGAGGGGSACSPARCSPRGPSDRLLGLLNELPPGGALSLPLVGCFALTIGDPASLASAWPAWRAAAPPAHGAAARRRAAPRRRAGALAPAPRPRGCCGSARGSSPRGGCGCSRRSTVLGSSAAFILLMLALAAELSTLANDPAALGKRYQLTRLAARLGRAPASPRCPASPPPRRARRCSALDSYSLGETIDLIAYPRRPHASSRIAARSPRGRAPARPTARRRSDVGLAQVLGLRVGSTLALAAAVRPRAAPPGRAASSPRSSTTGGSPTSPHAACWRPNPAAPEQLADPSAPRRRARGRDGRAASARRDPGHDVDRSPAAARRWSTR